MTSQVQTSRFTGTTDLSSYIASKREPEWVKQLRLSALERFDRLGWPTTEEEEWRRSDISYYDFESYEYSSKTPALEEIDLPSGKTGRIRMEMDRVTGAVLSEQAADRGVKLTALSQLVQSMDESHDLEQKLRTAMNRNVANIEHRFQAWHYAMYNDGVALYVPPGVELAEPIVIDIRVSSDKELAAPHVLVILDTGAAASVVQRVTGDEDGEVLYNEGATLALADGANLKFATFHDLNIDSLSFTNTVAYVGRDAAASHFTGAFGGMFAKHRADVHLVGEGADAVLNGLYFPREDQHMDLKTVQYHRSRNTDSRAYYKGTVAGEGRSVFQGLIQVEHGADKTDAYLTNNNLILNDGARADSIPSLRIATDDVKCSHGSTTGKIDPSQMHYLMTRGYSRTEARQMIVEGYFEDIAHRLDDELADTIRSVVRDRLEEIEE
jgi:Fe-S cluster assembly protein SufD